MRWLAIIPGAFVVGGAVGLGGAWLAVHNLTHQTRTRRP